MVGIDLSPEMVALARQAAPKGIEFVTGSAEDLDMPGQFDAIFCNSAFQWFTEPAKAIANCYAALRPDGRMVMQAPARHEFCPIFLRAVASLADDPRTAETWSHFVSPWTFYETAEEYERLFTDAGFALVGGEIEELSEHCTPSRALDMFDSGAGRRVPEPRVLRRAAAGRVPGDGARAGAREWPAPSGRAEAPARGRVLARVRAGARSPSPDGSSPVCPP